MSRMKFEGRAGSAGGGVASGLAFDAVINFYLKPVAGMSAAEARQEPAGVILSEPRILPKGRVEGSLMILHQRKIGMRPGRSMTLATLNRMILVLLASTVALCQPKPTYSPKAQARITKEIRHNILMLPDFGVFDNIAFTLNGYDVVLLGQVTQPQLKDAAERVVKKIEGVERVDNRIEVLPPSPNDDRLRRDVFIAIYRYGPLQHYGVGSNRPIRIIVNRGHVTLEGVVDRQSDKNMAGIRANGVFGVFSVQNNLMVPGKGR